MSSGTDTGDLAILRTANVDDGSGMKAGGQVKSKVKKVASMLRKQVRLMQDKLKL